MRTTMILSLFAICLIMISLTVSSYGQEAKIDSSAVDSLSVVKGVIVCINEELAKLRHIKPMCDKYGHLYGLKTSDGMIWSFMINPIGKKLREDETYFSKTIKVWGRFFYHAKIIEVTDFVVLEDEKQ